MGSEMCIRDRCTGMPHNAAPRVIDLMCRGYTERATIPGTSYQVLSHDRTYVRTNRWLHRITARGHARKGEGREKMGVHMRRRDSASTSTHAGAGGCHNRRETRAALRGVSLARCSVPYGKRTRVIVPHTWYQVPEVYMADIL